MKTRLSLVILFLVTFGLHAHALPLREAADGIYVKISVNDCMTCTAGLQLIKKQHPDARILLSSEYIADSSDIKEKFDLHAYTGSLNWDRELYNALSENLLSELVQVCQQKIVQRTLLKGAGRFVEKDCPDNPAYTLPGSVSIKDHKNFILVDNTLTEKKYFIDKQRGRMLPLAIDSALLAQVYIHNLGMETFFYEYMQIIRKQSMLRPRITAFTTFQDTLIACCLTSCYRDTVIGHDSFYSKIRSIVIFNREGSVVDVASNELANVHLDEYSFFIDKGAVYFGCSSSYADIASEKHTDYKVLKRLKRQQQLYSLDSTLAFSLSPYVVRNKIFYNYGDARYSNGYFATGCSDYIGSLKDGAMISIPFKKEVFDSNRMAYDGNPLHIKYGLFDFHYNTGSSTFTLLYLLDGRQYMARFKKGDARFRETIEIRSDWGTDGDRLRTLCLTHDGAQIMYVLKGDDRIHTCKFEDFKAICANAPEVKSDTD